MNGRGREQFKQIIAAEAEPSDHARPDEVLDPLQDLVGAVNESGVGAELVPGPGGRLTLTLWPRHRPALRSLMLPFVHDHGEVLALLSAGRRSFQTADELRGFLTEFAEAVELTLTIEEGEKVPSTFAPPSLASADGRMRSGALPPPS